MRRPLIGENMKFERTRVMNFEAALRGMRNPKNSWDKSDTSYDASGNPSIGPNDMRLAQSLIRAGSEHRKFMRQIFVSVDITAPIYWWKEFDTYKVGTTANSTSTMHKIHSAPITLGSFETGDYDPTLGMIDPEILGVRIDQFISDLEQLRQIYLSTGDKKYWKELIRWLPEAFLQKRTVTLNYENLLAMCGRGQRRFHKLVEWSEEFIRWARSLPYAQEFIFIDETGRTEREEVTDIIGELFDAHKITRESLIAILAANGLEVA